MSKVVLDVSMSLDGFVAGPNVREAEPSCRATVAPPISTGQSPIRTWRTDVAGFMDANSLPLRQGMN
jgi:hypothetical protein